MNSNTVDDLNNITIESLIPREYIDLQDRELARLNFYLQDHIQRASSGLPSLFYACNTDCNIYHLLYASLLGNLSRVYQINIVHDDFKRHFPPPVTKSQEFFESRGFFDIFLPKMEQEGFCDKHHYLLNDLMEKLNVDNDFQKLKSLIKERELVKAIDKISAIGNHSSVNNIETWIAETYIAARWQRFYDRDLPEDKKKEINLIIMGSDKFALYELVKSILLDSDNKFENIDVPDCLRIKQFFAQYKTIPKLCPSCERPVMDDLSEKTKINSNEKRHEKDVFMITIKSTLKEIEEAFEPPPTAGKMAVTKLTNELLPVLNMSIQVAQLFEVKFKAQFPEDFSNASREQWPKLYKSVQEFFKEISEKRVIPEIKEPQIDDFYCLPPEKWSNFLDNLSKESVLPCLYSLYKNQENRGTTITEIARDLESAIGKQKIGKLRVNSSHKPFVSTEFKILRKVICEDFVSANRPYYPKYKELRISITKEELEKWWNWYQENDE